MTRRADWQPRLLEALVTLRATPFGWAVHDCVTGTARCLDAITDGDDYEGRLRAAFPYDGMLGALNLLAAAPDGLRGLVSQVMGEPIPWGWAGAGDVVLVEDDAGQQVVGVCEGSQVICAGAPPLPMSRAICAWRVP